MKTPIILFSLLAVLSAGCGQRKTGPAPARSVLLSAKEGERYVGEQFQFFNVDRDGVISATNNAWFSLYYTEGRPFRLSGEVWLPEPRNPSLPDLPDGFGLFLREWDSLHRYGLTTRSIDVKRRLLAGFSDNNITKVASFTSPVFGIWIPFAVEASVEGISYRIGDQTAMVPGPLDMDGANKIVLATGVRLKDVRLEIIEPAR